MTPDETTPRSHSRLFAALLLIATFFAGIVIGVAGDRAMLLRQGRVLPREGMQFMASRIVCAMDRELKLTEGQHAKIESILDSRRQRIESIWSGIRPQVRGEIDRTNAEIRATLTPEQQTKFDELIARWEARTEKFLGRRSQ